MASNEKRKSKAYWDQYSKRLDDAAERVREIARTTYANYSPEMQSVMSLRNMLFWVDAADRRDDLDELTVYERFPELLDSKLCFFIDTMRAAFGTEEIAPILTDKHIEVYKLASYLYHGETTLEDELRAAEAGDEYRPSVEAEMQRTWRKDELQKCFLTHVDEAYAMAQIVQSRDIWDTEVLLELVKGSTNNSSLVDGAL